MSNGTKFELPTLTGTLTASVVKIWLDRCEDAFDAWKILNPEKELKESLKILLVGLKMEAPEASHWWGENRDTLKALATFSLFTDKVKERFMPSGWKMDALATFYAVRQHDKPFVDFVASLQSARSILGSAGASWKITDHVFKCHLLFYCNTLLSLRVRSNQHLAFDTIKLDSLISLMSSTWSSMVAEGSVTGRASSTMTLSSRSATVGSGRAPFLTDAKRAELRAAGGCYHCQKDPTTPGWVPHTSKTCPGDASLGIPSALTRGVNAISMDDHEEDHPHSPYVILPDSPTVENSKLRVIGAIGGRRIPAKAAVFYDDNSTDESF